MTETETSVVVTGTAWMGKGVGSIESALQRLLQDAKHEIMLTAYAIGGGSDFLFDWLEAALARGVLVKMIVNHLRMQPDEVNAELLRLTRDYPHFHLYNFISDKEADLHAKAVVVDRKSALVGSSNLSRRGLLANHEIALLSRGVVADTVAVAMDRLLQSQYAVPVPNNPDGIRQEKLKK